MSSVLGAGFDYPAAFESGKVAQAAEKDSVEAGIRFVLDTPVGNRFMLPPFGTRLHRLLFEGIGLETLTLARVYAEEDILQWVLRVARVQVDIENRSEQNRLDLHITYWTKGRPDPQTMVYPFYLERIG